MDRQGKHLGAALVAFGAAISAYSIWRMLRKPRDERRPKILIREIWVFPVKGCRGIRMDRWPLVATGLKYDREWCVVRLRDKLPLSLGAFPRLGSVTTKLTTDHLVLECDGSSIQIPLKHEPSSADQLVEVSLYEMDGVVRNEGEAAAKWFRDVVLKGMAGDVILGRVCTQRQPESSPSHVAVAPPRSVVNMHDFCALHIINDDGVRWLEHQINDVKQRDPPLLLDHAAFRASLVITGVPFGDEDCWDTFVVRPAESDSDRKPIEMRTAKLCGRCSIPTFDRCTGKLRPDFEPTATLRQLRRKYHDHQPASKYPDREPQFMFGTEVFHSSEGDISVGDVVDVRSRVPPPRFDRPGALNSD